MGLSDSVKRLANAVTPAELAETKRALALDRTHVRLEVERLHNARLYCWHHDPQGWVSAAAAADDDDAFDQAMAELDQAKRVLEAQEAADAERRRPGAQRRYLGSDKGRAANQRASLSYYYRRKQEDPAWYQQTLERAREARRARHREARN